MFVLLENEINKNQAIVRVKTQLIISLFLMFNINQVDATVQIKRTPLYLQLKLQYETFPGSYDIVMLGDSITERGHWQDMFPDVRIGNRGIGGDDTNGILERIATIKATGAKQVFLMVGTNDISHHTNPHIIVSNIIKIANKLEANKITPIIQSILLAGENRRAKNKIIKYTNTLLEKKIIQHGYFYMNINKKWHQMDTYLQNIQQMGHTLPSAVIVYGRMYWGNDPLTH
nr:GDSL-like Lipase/Acylhydrolase [Citrobacter werkmanii]